MILSSGILRGFLKYRVTAVNKKEGNHGSK